MGHIVNKEQTQSEPNEGFQLHRPELLIAAAHGDSDEIKRLLLLHREEDAPPQQEEVHIPVDEIVEKPAATAMSPSEAITDGEDSVIHVVASSGDAAKFLECATVVVGKANHLLHACNLKGDTPLHCATRLKNARMVFHLLALARAGDGTSDERDGTGDERVKAILRMQNLKGETVLHEAVRLEDEEMIGVLLSADSRLARVPLTDGTSPLYLALSLGHRDIALQLLEKDKELSYSGPDGQNAFHAAILWKHGEEAIEMLLERNKDLIKQADRSTGRTPLHYAALFGETSVTELLLSADPSPAYLRDSNGSFPIHLAASNGQPDKVLALLQENKSRPGGSSKKKKSGPGDSSKEKESGHYCAQLRDGKGRTFLHVAIQKKSWGVVMHACRWQGKMFASSVMNMQDDDGNTALHLAVKVGDIRIVRALVSIPEVKLNLTNKKGGTPRELAFIRYIQQGTHSLYSNPVSSIYGLLHDAAHLTASPRENTLPRSQFPQKKRKEKKDRSQIINVDNVGSVLLQLIMTATFAAAFAVPGGYRVDGTPTLAGQYAFDAFVRANTLAFFSSGLSAIFLMFTGTGFVFAGLGAELRTRLFSLFNSLNLLAWSARSLGAAFACGMYAVLAPVEATRLWTCGVTVGAFVLVEAGWGFRAVTMVCSDKVVLMKRFGISRAWWRLARAFVVSLMCEFGPYIIISTSRMPGYGRVH